MKKTFLSKWNKTISFLLLSPLALFGASGNGGNIANQLATSVNTEIESAAKNVASIVETIAVAMGAIWIVIMLVMAFFAMEQIKQHSKMLFGAIVLIGAIYGIAHSLAN